MTEITADGMMPKVTPVEQPAQAATVDATALNEVREKPTDYGKSALDQLAAERMYRASKVDEKNIGVAKAETYRTNGFDEQAHKEATDQVRQLTNQAEVRKDASFQAIDMDHRERADAVAQYTAEQTIAAAKAQQDRAAAKERADRMIANSWGGREPGTVQTVPENPDSQHPDRLAMAKQPLPQYNEPNTGKDWFGWVKKIVKKAA